MYYLLFCLSEHKLAILVFEYISFNLCYSTGKLGFVLEKYRKVHPLQSKIYFQIVFLQKW